MLIVADVPASAAWYGELFGFRGGHGGDQFEMMMGEDGQLELMLHHQEFGEHPGMTDPREGTPGRGVLLVFSVSDAQSVFDRATEMHADLLDEPHFNTISRSTEFTVRDLDGYPVSISEWGGSEAAE